MHAKCALILLTLSSIAACATPLERCLATSERSVKRIEHAIATADANIARGYAIHRYEEPIVVPKHCHDDKGRKYRCDETEYHTLEVPVEIDIWAERERRDELRDDLIYARGQVALQSQQCFASYPEA
ncbi:hypothetical protein J7382_12880 [Shimia sp. R11_0]|uniref:hypothetical protein n=1 Tax=Shimia sp. R11_0 TaxID=2821096 RepID=UPI001ADA4BB8|nr:hypothetical protein [Shimia sp. R11_0]MBO9478434.1 hypothetical protein [Shimia sp. R11_0]